MTREERDRAIAELRAHLERRDKYNHDRRATRGLAALDALIASERQAEADCLQMWREGWMADGPARALNLDQRRALGDRLNEYAKRDRDRELAGGDGG